MNKEEILINNLENIKDNFADNLLIDLLNETIYYIKKLQQENKQLNNTNFQLSTLNTNLRSTRDNYKYKINKASELLIKFYNENQPYLDEVEDCCGTKINSILEILGDNNGN